MGNLKIKPVKRLEGKIKVPGDKSISHRAVMIGALAEGKTEVEGFLNAEDCLNTVRAFQSMGIKIEGMGSERLSIFGQGLSGLSEPGDILDVGNSGTTMRLLLGILAGQNFSAIITGDDSLRQRPMKRVTEPLKEMGALISGPDQGNLAPLTIRGGNLKPINYHCPIPSAQVKSAILLAGLYAEGETSVTEPAKSRDHTERMLKLFGAEVAVDGLRVSVRGKPKLTGQSLTVPGDISSASFIMVAAGMIPGSRVTITDVGINPTRKEILKTLETIGVKISLSQVRENLVEPMADITVEGNELQPIDLDSEVIARIIDEIPAIAVAATVANGRSQIRGASELRVKETDRLRALATNLTKLGARVEEGEDGLIIQGGRHLIGTEVDSFGDHRMAMAMAVAGLVAEGETTVTNTDCINTSFPKFMDTLERIAVY
ncbi:3-phosphoshikimate 1-carboxyvinyltransferase [bacterium]|nr:3-phosphoshikimate 1-carboxyvinyltransferase [bacterium]MCK4326473.1 3-phosphoshikimate 1-carboxyvinyltransferase [bacterium]